MQTRITVYKLGGALLDDETKRDVVLRSIAEQKGFIIVVHGGGVKATELSASLGVKSQLIEGRRVTDAQSLEIVTMVYAGLINKTVVASLQALAKNAIGLCGADADVIRSHKRTHASIDFGFVGDVDRVNADLLLSLVQKDLVPVLAPITHDGSGQLLNTNADTIAAEVASALQHVPGVDVELVYCFEKRGVLTDVSNESSLISRLDHAQYVSLRESAAIHSGMIAKLDNAFAAARQGVLVRISSYSNLNDGTRIDATSFL